MPGCLNSVILEGDFIDSTYDFNAGEKGSHFTMRIKSVSWPSFSGQKEKEEGVYVVCAMGKLADMCHEVLEKGRGIRVVGRLACEGNFVRIIAEHVEFKPLARKGA